MRQRQEPQSLPDRYVEERFVPVGDEFDFQATPNPNIPKCLHYARTGQLMTFVGGYRKPPLNREKRDRFYSCTLWDFH